jgi:hypothetical protein
MEFPRWKLVQGSLGWKTVVIASGGRGGAMRVGELGEA